MNKIIAVALFALPLVLLAEETIKPTLASPVRKGSVISGAKLGGYICKPDSQKGVALVVNAQSRVAESNLTFVTGRLQRDSGLNFSVKSVDPKVLDGDWTSLREKENAAALVVVVDKPDGYPLMVVPDERWAVVNVAKLDRGLTRPESKEALIPKRTRRQVIRAFALIAGSGKKRVESPASVNSMMDLDSARDAVPMDTIQMMSDFLHAQGMTKQVISSYRTACRQGWAPAPTNDVQKKIWDDVHSIPNRPMQIKFDPATQKGKVTK